MERWGGEEKSGGKLTVEGGVSMAVKLNNGK